MGEPVVPRHDGQVSDAVLDDEGGPADHDESAASPPQDAHDPRPWWRRVDRSVLGVTGLVAIGFVIVVQGVLSGVTGDDRNELPPLVEEVLPVPEAAQVLGQASVFVDLAEGYTGVLVIDGIELETITIAESQPDRVEPGQQVDLPTATIFEPGNHTLTFTPSEGAPIERFDEGRHRVEVVYWAIDEGPARSRTFAWTFDSV